MKISDIRRRKSEWANVRSKAVDSAQVAFLDLLSDCLTDATIRIRLLDSEFVLGTGQGPPAVTIFVHRPRFFARVLTQGNLGMAEAFMDEDFEIIDGSLADLLSVLLRGRLPERLKLHPRQYGRVIALRLRNVLRGRRRNVRQHYDIGDDLFEAFLDKTLTYSCGYAITAEDGLEQLQSNKLERICRKLRLVPGVRVLDIGCGYGGLLIHAAKQYGVKGLGVTLSRRHFERATEIVSREGLANQIQIELRDYTTTGGTFDRVVSVGMMEHLPSTEYRRYFRKIAHCLGSDGIGLVHSIGCNGRRNVHDPFIQAHIFPGSNQPRLSEIASALESSDLAILDVENIVRHYAYTCSRWLEKFKTASAFLDTSRYDSRFQRMWEYYLSCGIAGAQASEAAVYQILFMKNHAGSVPLKRI